jgi:hypothetical protein
MCVALAVTGCASAGTKIDPNAVAAFQKGRTTIADAEAALGDPSATTTLSNGTTSLVYSYAQSSVRAATFIPVVGAFVGGADAKAQTVVLIFGPKRNLPSSQFFHI